MPTGKIRLIKHGNSLVVDTLHGPTVDMLCDKFQFRYRRRLEGIEAREAEKYGAPLIEVSVCDNFTFDHRGRFVTGFGCYPRLTRLLEERGYEIEFLDQAPGALRPRAYEINEKAMRRCLSEFEGNQRDRFFDLISQERANAKAATGWGKSFIIRAICQVYSRAKIDIVSKRVPVIHGSILTDLQGAMLDAGKVGGGKQTTGARIACVSADSLHHRDGDADILVVDEAPELCTDRYMQQLAKYQRARMYCFSATPTRWDGSHAMLEPLFGLPIFEVPTQEAIRMGRIVPAEVYWTTVTMDYDPAAGLKASNHVERSRRMYWRNDWRNQLIAQAAELYPDLQTMVLCDKVEHVMAIRKHLRHFTPVFVAENQDIETIHGYIREGAISADEPLPYKHQREAWQSEFSTGALQKVIVNDVWNVGVNFPFVQLLVMASHAGEELLIQKLGRGLRKAAEIGKTHVIVREFYDTFNESAKRKSKERFAVYQKEGHKQYRVDAMGRAKEIDRL